MAAAEKRAADATHRAANVDEIVASVREECEVLVAECEAECEVRILAAREQLEKACSAEVARTAANAEASEAARADAVADAEDARACLEAATRRAGEEAESSRRGGESSRRGGESSAGRRRPVAASESRTRRARRRRRPRPTRSARDEREAGTSAELSAVRGSVDAARTKATEAVARATRDLGKRRELFSETLADVPDAFQKSLDSIRAGTASASRGGLNGVRRPGGGAGRWVRPREGVRRREPRERRRLLARRPRGGRGCVRVHRRRTIGFPRRLSRTSASSRCVPTRPFLLPGFPRVPGRSRTRSRTRGGSFPAGVTAPGGSGNADDPRDANDWKRLETCIPTHRSPPRRARRRDRPARDVERRRRSCFVRGHARGIAAERRRPRRRARQRAAGGGVRRDADRVGAWTRRVVRARWAGRWTTAAIRATTMGRAAPAVPVPVLLSRRVAITDSTRPRGRRGSKFELAAHKRTAEVAVPRGRRVQARPPAPPEARSAPPAGASRCPRVGRARRALRVGGVRVRGYRGRAAAAVRVDAAAFTAFADAATAVDAYLAERRRRTRERRV